MTNFFERLFPLITLQFVHFRALRTSWLILVLLALLVTLAMTFPVVPGDPLFWIRHLWIMALLLHAALMAISIADSRRTTLVMHSMQRLRQWIRAQILATLCVELPAASILWIIFGIAQSDPFTAFYNAMAMALFLTSTSIAVFGSLQTTLLSIDAAKANRIRLVVSAPWLLVAWIFGVSAGLSAAHNQPPLAELCALAALAMSNAAFHTLLNRETRE